MLEPHVNGPTVSYVAVISTALFAILTALVVAQQTAVIDRPDVLIVEGLNVLQPARMPRDGEAIPFVSDFFDFSIYIDATDQMIESWYVERFLRLRQTAFRDPASYFHRFATLSEEEARAFVGRAVGTFAFLLSGITVVGILSGRPYALAAPSGQ